MNVVLILILLFLRESLPNIIERNGTLKNKKCEKDSECPSNGFCEKNHTCKCNVGYIIHEENNLVACLKEISHYGEECVRDIQCMVTFDHLAKCQKDSENSDFGKCICQEGSHFKDNICYKTSYIGQSCEVNDNCFITSPNTVAYCHKSICTCPIHRHPNPNGTECLPSARLEEACTTDNDCIVQNSRCFGACRCQVGYVLSVNRDACLEAADKLESQCEENNQCTEYLNHAMCDSKQKKCVCAPYAHETQGSCWVSTGLGESCEHPFECISELNNITSVECKYGRCSCVPGNKLVDKICTGSVAGQVISTRLLCVFLLTSLFLK